jgi:predicted MFS family arabinose efflux permease
LTQGIIGPVASYFEVTSLTAVLPTILAVLSTALVPFYTKVADVFGRAGSLTYAFSSYLMGLTIEGTARSFTQLAIGQIFYGMGLTGMQALSQVVIAGMERESYSAFLARSPFSCLLRFVCLL